MFKRFHHCPARASAIILSAILPAACADPMSPGPEIPDPQMALVAGEYSAAGEFGALSFTTSGAEGTTDWIAEGAELTILLQAGGTVEGRLYMPISEESAAYFEEEDVDRGYIDEDMTGSWTLEGGRVRLTQSADTFVRDMTMVYTDGVLSGDRSFDGIRVLLVLIRQE